MAVNRIAVFDKEDIITNQQRELATGAAVELIIYYLLLIIVLIPSIELRTSIGIPPKAGKYINSD